MSKKIAKKTAPRTVTSLDVLGALFYGEQTDDSMQRLLPLAEAALPEIVARHFDLCVVSAAALPFHAQAERQTCPKPSPSPLAKSSRVATRPM